MAAASGGRSGCQPSMLPARSEERAPAADAASASNATSSRYCISVMLCRESPSVSGATGIRGRWIQQGTPGRGQRAGLLAGSQAGGFLLEDHRVMFGTICVITPASRLATARSRSSDQSGMPARASDVPRLRRTRSVRASRHAKVIHSVAVQAVGVDVQLRRCRCGGDRSDATGMSGAGFRAQLRCVLSQARSCSYSGHKPGPPGERSRERPRLNSMGGLRAAF